MRRSSCITQMGPKSNDKCPYKRHTEGTHRKVGSNVTMEAEIEAMWSQGKGCHSHQRQEEARNGFSPRAFTGSMVVADFSSGLQNSEE